MRRLRSFANKANTEAAERKGRVLYVGHSYYNTWYLSRALRARGWKADTLNIDPDQIDDLRCIEVNSVWEEITGINRDRVIGHTIREVMPDFAEEWLLSLNELAATGRKVKFCRYLAAADRWFEVQAVQPFCSRRC